MRIMRATVDTTISDGESSVRGEPQQNNLMNDCMPQSGMMGLIPASSADFRTKN